MNIQKNKEYLDFVIDYTNYFINNDGSINGYNRKHYSTDDASESRILFDLLKYTNDEKVFKSNPIYL